MNSTATSRVSLFLIYLFLVLMVAGMYAPVVRYDFVNFDDPDYVFQNPYVQQGLTLDNLIWSFKTGAASNWHPLTWISLMLDRQCFGPSPAGFHFTNILLHTINTLLLFTILWIMTRSRWASALVAALFAGHPLHIESVAWIAERKDVLCTGFWLLTMGCYYSYTRKGGTARYILTLVMFALGLMAKPMLVTLPLILLLLDFWPLQRLTPFTRKILLKRIWEKIPFFICTILACLATIFAQFSGGTVATLTKIPLPIRLSNAVLSYWRYLAKMFWPANLSFFYPYPKSTGTGTWWIESAVACIALIVLTAFLIRAGRKHKFLITGWLWYLITLVPVIGFMHVGSQSYANRYTYIPLIGIFIIAAWGIPPLLQKLPYKKLILTVLSLIILTSLSIRTAIEVRYWKDSVTLCQRAIQTTQQNFMAEILLGQALYTQGNIDDAASHFLKSIRLQPDNAYAHYNLGLIAIKQKRFDDAVRYFEQATRIKPSNDNAWCSLGFALLQLRKPKDALPPLREAVRLNPASDIAHFHLATSLEQMHNYQEALLHYKESIRLNPGNPLVLNSLAWLLATSDQSDIRNPQEAIQLAEKACRLTENKDPLILDTLAAALAATGRFPDAAKFQQLAIDIIAAAKDPAILEDFNKRLVLYQSGKPYQAP